MGDPVDPELFRYVIRARCETAANVYLRPITWRLEEVEGLPPFSDFIDVRCDTDDGHAGLILREEDPSERAYCQAPEPIACAAGFGVMRRNNPGSSKSVTMDYQGFAWLIKAFSGLLTL